MRVASILSSFPIILGNSVLHLIMVILSTIIKEPTQAEMDKLIKELDATDLKCATVAELHTSIHYAQSLHFVAFCILFYIQWH